MSDLNVTVSISLPINVVSFLRGRPATRWEPADPDEVDFEIDAPQEVRDWLMAHIDSEWLQEIEATIIEQAEKNYADMISDWYEARA